MTESRPLGAAKEKPKKERAQHSHAHRTFVALLRARPPRARRHQRLRPNCGWADAIARWLEE